MCRLGWLAGADPRLLVSADSRRDGLEWAGRDRFQASGLRAGRARFSAALRMTAGGAELAGKGQSEILRCAQNGCGWAAPNVRTVILSEAKNLALSSCSSQCCAHEPGHPSLKSFQSRFSDLMSATFLNLVQPLSCFSRLIAALGSPQTS